MNPVHLAAGRHTEPDILKLLLAHKTCTADVLNARCKGENGNTAIDQIGWTQETIGVILAEARRPSIFKN